MLQTRNGKRTGLAAIRIAVDMCEAGMITPREALMRVEPEQLNQLLRPIFSPESRRVAVAEGRVLAKGQGYQNPDSPSEQRFSRMLPWSSHSSTWCCALSFVWRPRA